MEPQLVNGWLKVPYDGPDLCLVEIGVGPGPQWAPAFLDWLGSQRCAQIRPPESTGRAADVWLRVSGRASKAGRVVL